MDQQTEAYNVFRLHHEGADKTIQQIAAGTLRCVVVPGDKKFQTEFLLYTDIAHAEGELMFGVEEVIGTWLQIAGIASEGARTSIHAVAHRQPAWN